MKGKEVKIRGVSSKALKQLDEEAAKRDMSRNQLTKSLIESFAITPELQALDEKYAALVRMCLEELKKNTQALHEAARLIKKLSEKES